MNSFEVEHSGRREALNTKKQLRQVLLELEHEPDPNIAVIHSSGDFLSISVMGLCALVRFTHSSGDPPYLSASTGETSDPDCTFEFLVGDTPTPVPTDRCIPIEGAMAIAEYFFDKGEIPRFVKWKED